jgi:hypothetical protein
VIADFHSPRGLGQPGRRPTLIRSGHDLILVAELIAHRWRKRRGLCPPWPRRSGAGLKPANRPLPSPDLLIAGFGRIPVGPLLATHRHQTAVALLTVDGQDAAENEFCV